MSDVAGSGASQLKFAIEVIAGIASAFGVTVALIRPWIQNITSKRRLKLRLVTTVGDLTTMDAQNAKGEIPVFYYYLLVENGRPTLPANNTKVIVTGRSARVADASFTEEPLIVPVPLTWNFPNEKSDAITISKTGICAFGIQTAPDGVTPLFQLSTYPRQTPRNFRAQIVPTEVCRFRIEARSDDCYSRPIILEIRNNGDFNPKGISIQ